MSKVKTLAILGVGYVLGAQAGRPRYEQIKRQALRVVMHPRTQQLAQQARDAVSAKLPPTVGSRLQNVGSQGSRDAGATPAGTGGPDGTLSARTVEMPMTNGIEPASPPSQL
ncbi:MAG TPA: hypothetical protein VI248_05105 [Kineosporiaceae bacterium]